MSVSDQVFGIFQRRGSAAYFGERVSMTEHSLQAAHFAQLEAAPHWLIVAALLHDIGHLVVPVPDDIQDWTKDAHHEETGSQWLAQRLGPEIAQTVRLHVPAKRYLCATDQDYFALLSSASVITLGLQGGPMSAAEVKRFEAERFHREAVRLRRWDDQGKVAGLPIAPLEEYRDLIESVALTG